MRLKKVIKWIILSCIFIIVSYFFIKVTTYIMKPDTVDLKNIAGLYGEDKNTLDMVYIGGSASFVYWEPLRAFEKEGIASYDFGANTIQPELYKTMIKEILKTQKPELILIDARAFQYREKDQPPKEVAYRNVLTGLPMSINKIQFISQNVNKYLGDDEISYYFDIIKYHRDLKGKTINNQLKMAFNCYKNPNKGFYFNPKIAQVPVTQIEDINIKTPIAKETEDILIDLLEYIKTTNCNYLFVVSPYVEEQEHKNNFNYVADIVENYGYKFLDSNDYYENMQIDFNKDFYNTTHVNIFGADKYTDFLTQYIKENYNLPNRKEDKNYKEWLELLPTWNRNSQKTKEKINKLMSSN